MPFDHRGESELAQAAHFGVFHVRGDGGRPGPMQDRFGSVRLAGPDQSDALIGQGYSAVLVGRREGLIGFRQPVQHVPAGPHSMVMSPVGLAMAVTHSPISALVAA